MVRSSLLLMKKIYLFNLSRLIIVMTTSTPEKQDGLKALNDAIAKIKETITSLGGVFQIQMPVSYQIFFSN